MDDDYTSDRLRNNKSSYIGGPLTPNHPAYKTVMKYDKRLARNEAIKKTLATIFFTPLSIACNVISILSRVAATFLSMGIPYGIYCGYKVFIQMREGISFFETTHRFFFIVFIVFPFAGLLLHVIFRRLYIFFGVRS